MPLPNGPAIKAIRQAQGWKLTNFASAVRISDPHLCNIERGKGASEEVLRRIADTLGVPIAAVTSNHTLEQINGRRLEALASPAGRAS